MSEPIILGIESTCDETAAAIMRGSELLAHTVASSMHEHARYGGVIPEIASRAHAQALMPVIQQTLQDASMSLHDIDAFAVSAGPGLAGCLAVGVCAAKSLALACGKPLYAINHVIAHVAVTQLQFGDIPDHTCALIVSGGHTSLLNVNDIARDVQVIGTTLDDAAGECFDKVARILGFAYPGGPAIDAHAKLGNKHAIAFPQGLTQGRAGKEHPYDFSFSGVKTAVARYVESCQMTGERVPVDDVCASLAYAVSSVLARKTIAGCLAHEATTLIVGGGFSANSQLRQALLAAGNEAGITVRLPELKWCTDNGAMVATLAMNLLKAGVQPSPLHCSIDSAMSLSTVSL